MTTQELIKKYDISLQTNYVTGKGFVPTGKLCVHNADEARKNGDFNTIISCKPEIMRILREEWDAERRAYKERQEKINAIPGLTEIQNAREDLRGWNVEFEKSFDDVGGLGVRPMPKYDFDAMNAKYPRAAAYLKAKSYADAANYAKAAAGRNAVEKIINGEDYEEALKTMEAEWSAYCDAHMWD